MPASFSPVSFPLMNMQQASPVASALANMMQMQQLRQQTALANVAPKLYGGQAAAAQGIGQQELGVGAYANPMAQAQLQQQQIINKYLGKMNAAQIAQILSQAGLNAQQVKNLAEAKTLMPGEFGLNVTRTNYQYPIQALISNQGVGGITNLTRNLLNFSGRQLGNSVSPGTVVNQGGTNYVFDGYGWAPQ